MLNAASSQPSLIIQFKAPTTTTTSLSGDFPGAVLDLILPIIVQS